MRNSKKAILILGFILTFLACNQKKEKESNIYFIVKHADKELKKGDFIPPSPLFYGQSNFILVDSSKIYYHNNHIFHWCGTGIDFSKPPKLSITPHSLKEIKMNDVLSFLKKTLPDTIDKRYYVIISTPSDTIKNKAFETISNYLKSKNSNIYNVRKCTEEEQYVLTSKIKNEKYNPSTINWKIGFDSEYSLHSKRQK